LVGKVNVSLSAATPDWLTAAAAIGKAKPVCFQTKMKGGRRQAPRRLRAYAGERPSTRARICKLAERTAARSAEAAASTATPIVDESADLV
jgi:hypothetical protein